jgi:hypothetical protein
MEQSTRHSVFSYVVLHLSFPSIAPGSSRADERQQTYSDPAKRPAKQRPKDYSPQQQQASRKRRVGSQEGTNPGAINPLAAE